jgi:succinoglycan biosynthesis transport protein ExoP
MNPSDSDRLLTFDVLANSLRRSWWILILCAIIGGGGAYAAAKTSAKRYTATASLLFNTSPELQEVAGLTASPDTSPSQGVEDTNVSLIRLGMLGVPAIETARLVGHGLTRAAVAQSLSISPESDTELVSVASTATSPALASRIANTYAEQFIASQQRQTRVSYRSALSAIDRQLAALAGGQQSSVQRGVLQQRAQSLGTLAQLQNSGIRIAQPATAPNSPSSPDLKLYVILGVLGGLALAAALTLLRERLDGRVRFPEQLEVAYGEPLLGVIPEDAAIAVRPTIAARSASGEAFQRLRARLRYLNVDRELRTIVMTSALPGDGKTTAAYNLAVASVRAGRTTLLIEADLRRPDLASHLGLEADPGLAAVLVRGCAFEEAIRTMALPADSNGRLSGLLDVIPAGSVSPPNPSELLESRAMNTVLANAREIYELIIIDTPALGVVSDAIPLLAQADGVIVVSDMRTARFDVARGVRGTLEGIAAPVLGVVANRAPRRSRATYEPAQGHERDPLTLQSLNGQGPATRVSVASESAEGGWQ